VDEDVRKQYLLQVEERLKARRVLRDRDALGV